MKTFGWLAALLLLVVVTTHSQEPNDRLEAIHRSEKTRHEFMISTGFPHGRPGYIMDHIDPLACGGPDLPSNLGWQTVADAKAKDRWERQDCGVWDRPSPPCRVPDKDGIEVCDPHS